MNLRSNPDRRQYMIDNDIDKQCSYCKEWKTVDLFYWQKSHNSPAARCKQCWTSQQRERFHTDPEFRKRHMGYIKDWLDNGGREHVNGIKRKRWHEDPEYRARQSKNHKQWFKDNREEWNARQRERYQNDEEYRQRHLAAVKTHKLKIKKRKDK